MPELSTDAATSSRHDPIRVSPARGRMFVRACAVAAIPLILLFLPLLAHRSEDATVFTFSTPYFTFLTAAALSIIVLAVIVGSVCALSRSVLPAFAFVTGLLALVATCLIAETVLTYRLRLEDAFSQYSAWGHKRSLLFAFEATPNHEWVNAGATYTTDRFGFRTHVSDPSWDAHDGTRIFTLGESSVFGYGLNDAETWPHLLEGKLRAARGDPSLTVVNAGNNGHTSLQTLFRFYTKVLPLKPSRVLLYLGPNDVYGTGPDRLMISEDILFSGSVAQYWAAETRGMNPYARSLLFYVVQERVPVLKRRMEKPKMADTPEMIAAQAEAWNRNEKAERETIGKGYVENIRTICLISQAHGITPVIVTFMQNKQGWAAGVLRDNNALLRRLASEQGITLIDVAGAFESVGDKASYFFEDQYHPNRKGAEFIASTIAQAWQ